MILRQQLLRGLNAQIGHKAMWREAGRFAKQSREMKGAQASFCREIVERDFLGKTRIDELEHTLQPLRIEHRCFCGLLPTINRLIAEQAGYRCRPHAVHEKPVCRLNAPTEQIEKGGSNLLERWIGETASVSQFHL